VRPSPGPLQPHLSLLHLRACFRPAIRHSFEIVQGANLLLGLLQHPATPVPQSDAAPVLFAEIVLRVSSALAFTWAFLPLLEDCTSVLLRGIFKKTNITGNHQGALQKPYDKTFMCTKSHWRKLLIVLWIGTSVRFYTEGGKLPQLLPSTGYEALNYGLLH
jgi:hypothetical protein